MSRIVLIPACKMFALALIFCASGLFPASAQTADRRQMPQESREIVAPQRTAPASAHQSELICGGFITRSSPASSIEIVGAYDESERRMYAQGDLVYINAGAGQNVEVGQEFTVVRPRGQFRSEFSRKKGSLGVYTQEIGRLRVVRVRDGVSVAEVVGSCESVLSGDLLRPATRVVSPAASADHLLDRFAAPTGKQTGRIVLARDGREVLARDNVVFIDLGAEDDIEVGDRLTVFRPEGHGVIVKYGDEIAANARRGFESDEFRGGKFSNQAQRLSDVDGSIYGETVKTPDVKERRPPVPRKVVGELVVLHVEGRTAKAVVTRAVREIYTGDYVELQ